MRDKGKILIVTCSWLAIAVLAILSFAGIISPQKAISIHNEATLAAPATTPADRSTKLSVTVNVPVDEVHASLSLDSGNRSAIIGSLDLPGNLEDIAIDRERQLAFLANSFSGVQIADISDPKRPSLLGVIATPGNAWDLMPHGDLLFVAAAQGGLQIIDTSTPEKPTRIAEFVLPDKPFLKLAHHQNTIYASGGKHGLFIIDVADAGNPQLIDTIAEGDGVWGVIAAENYLYITSGKYFLDTYHLERPHRPKRVDRQLLPNRVWEMGFVKGHLYVPTRKEGLLVFDVGNPKRPYLLPRSKDRIDVETIAVDHNIALLTNRKKDIFAYDISNPAMPIRVLECDLAFRPRNSVLVDNLAFVATGLTGLQVVDISKVPRQKVLTSMHIPGLLTQVIFDDNYFYLATGKHGLYIAEKIPGKELSTIVSSLPLPGLVQNMVRSGDYLYVASSKAGLLVVDITDQTAPKLIGTMNHPGIFRDIAINGNNLYITTIDDGLLVVNITFPDNPILLGQLPLPSAMSLAVKDDRAYVASTGNGVHIIDISTPSTPRVISQANLPWPFQQFAKFHQMSVAEDAIYMAAGEGELIIYDISDENHPKLAEIAHIDGEALAVAVKEGKVYVATRQGRLWIMERDNNKLSLRGLADILGNCRAIKFTDDKIVLANGEKGLTIISEPQQLTVRQADATSRVRTPALATIDIPPQAQPAVYNLALFQDGKVQEFFGAVKVTERQEN